jgi:hypothetical protein
MFRSRSFFGLVIGLCLIAAVSAHADPVTHWHAIATPAINAGRPGPPGLMDYALVQVAVHDAVQVIEGQYQPYHYSDPSMRGQGSTAAAVAAATHRMLVLLYGVKPALEAEYAAYILALDPTGTDAAVASGVDIGEAAAEAIHLAHYRPLIVLDNPSFGNDGIGQWRSPVALAFEFLAACPPFTLNRVDQFRPQPPPPLTSMTYVRDYAEVQAIGKNTAHPNANTDLARFWSGNFFVQWNETVRQIAENHLETMGERARLLALANLTAADTAMAVWESKAFYNLWRPSTAIQLGGDDGNDRTAGDPGWLPLLGNPPYPDYVSGANGVTGAYTGLLRAFFGRDDVSFSVKNANPLVIDQERDFTSFSQAADEVVDARILLGIHFRFADVEGRRLGERIAHWAFQKFLRPIPGNQD